MKKFFFIFFCSFSFCTQAMVIAKDPLYVDRSINLTYIHQIVLIIHNHEQIYMDTSNSSDKRYANLLILFEHSHTLAHYLYQYDEHEAAKGIIKTILSRHTDNEFTGHFPIREKLERLSTLSHKIEQCNTMEQKIIADFEQTWSNCNKQRSLPQKKILYQQSDYDFVDSIFN